MLLGKTIFFCLSPLDLSAVTLFFVTDRDYFAVLPGFSTAVPSKWNQAFRRLLHTRECCSSCQVRLFLPAQFGRSEYFNVLKYFSHQYGSTASNTINHSALRTATPCYSHSGHSRSAFKVCFLAF